MFRPRVIVYSASCGAEEVRAGMLNAIGLQGIGVHRFVRERLPELRERRAIVIVNVCGTTIDEYCEVSRILSDHEGVAAIAPGLAN